MLINSRLRNSVLQSKSVHVTELDDASKARAGSLRASNIYISSGRRENTLKVDLGTCLRLLLTPCVSRQPGEEERTTSSLHKLAITKVITDLLSLFR